jgi:radical SAM protein with 4Fe4S-binding SPASM domain
MYVDDSRRTLATHRRPHAQRLTAPFPATRHPLEDWLDRPAVRRVLRWLSTRGGDGRTRFEAICANFDNRELRGFDRIHYGFFNLLIEFGLRHARLDREVMKKNLFHHPPTVKALALTARSIARYGLTTPQRFTAPLFVVWNLTQACNLTCRHCYQDAQHKPLGDELTTAQKLNAVDQMADNFVPFVAFAGGEPLVSPDLWPVLERCRERGLHVTVATNGTLLTPSNCERLRDAGVKYVEVSLDSPDPAQHDTFRGVPGAWRHTTQGIRNAVAAGIRTGMACCFTRDTVTRADEMVQLAIDLGCKTFAFFNFIPVGRGRAMLREDLTPQQREGLLHLLQQRFTEGQINVISTAPQFGRACIAYGAPDGVFATGHAGGGRGGKAMVLARYLGGCGAGRCYCCIQPTGVVTPCVYIPKPVVGDLRRQSLAEIWENELFRTLSDRDDYGDHCGVCDYRRYCGGCRARALSYTGDIQAGDPGCIYNQAMWDELARSVGDGRDVALPAETPLAPAVGPAKAVEPLFPCSEAPDELRRLIHLQHDREA